MRSVGNICQFGLLVLHAYRAGTYYTSQSGGLVTGLKVRVGTCLHGVNALLQTKYISHRMGKRSLLGYRDGKQTRQTILSVLICLEAN